MYSLQYRAQMDQNKYYGPSVACTVGSTWLMYSLCMSHIWPMYDLHMAHIAFRSAISSAIRSAPRTDHQGVLAKKKVIWLLIMTVEP